MRSLDIDHMPAGGLEPLSLTLLYQVRMLSLLVVSLWP